jgi:hypothetical protein
MASHIPQEGWIFLEDDAETLKEPFFSVAGLLDDCGSAGGTAHQYIKQANDAFNMVTPLLSGESHESVLWGPQRHCQNKPKSISWRRPVYST